MLIEFNVENYLSFRDRATLSMVRATADKSLPKNYVARPHKSRHDLLRSAAIYGPNAAGKSNLVKAMGFACDFVVNSAHSEKSNASVPVRPFKLDARTRTQPSEFEFTFLHEGVQCTYGFSVDAKRVWKEWLISHSIGSTRVAKRVLFKRKYDEQTDQDEYYFGPSWSGQKTQISRMTRPNALFLSVATQFNHEEASQIFRWFDQCIKGVGTHLELNTTSQLTARLVHESDDFKARSLQFLKQADLGITDLLSEAIPLRETDVWIQMPEPLQQLFKIADGSDPMTHDVKTLHQSVGADGKKESVPFDLEEESDGTVALFSLAAPWLSALAKGLIVVIDELDLHLHPMLTKWLIGWFHSPKTNPHDAQLIFTTHDDNLLDLDIFRRDQIWFVDRDSDGASSLNSLWDFKKQPVRKQENIRRGYLAGRYGAVPFLEEIL